MQENMFDPGMIGCLEWHTSEPETQRARSVPTPLPSTSLLVVRQKCETRSLLAANSSGEGDARLDISDTGT